MKSGNIEIAAPRECDGAKSVPADNRRHVETNRRAPDDAGGICAEQSHS